MSPDDTDERDEPDESGPSQPERFEPIARRRSAQPGEHDRLNIRGELDRILTRTETVTRLGHDAFTEGSASYDVASMAVIRLAALLERAEFASFARLLSDDEVAALRTTRNIAAHAGYIGMNDDLFWTAITVRLPAIVRRLLAAEPGQSTSAGA